MYLVSRSIEILSISIEILCPRYAKGICQFPCGLIALVSMDNDSEGQLLVDRFGLDGYNFYRSVANGTNPDFAEGVKLLPVYFPSRYDLVLSM
jgi:hypothetical protein